MKTKRIKNDAGLKNRTKQVGEQQQAASEVHVPTDNQPAQPPPWRGVFFRGPDPVQDNRSEGEEIPTWLVYVGDDEGEPVGTTYRVFSYTRAAGLAKRMANDRHLELIDEAQPAGPLAPAAMAKATGSAQVATSAGAAPVAVAQAA